MQVVRKWRLLAKEIATSRQAPLLGFRGLLIITSRVFGCGRT